jgi:hypothetical protein
MTNYKYLRGASISDPSRVIFDIPDTPTIGTATDVGTSRAYNNGAATVTITSQAVTGGPTTGYTVTSSPDGFTGSGTSPITVTGLQTGTSYTFTAKATNTSGSSPATTATGAITATTVPQAPTIGTFTDGGDGSTGTLSFTAGATGGKSITGYKVSTDGSTYTTVSGTTSPLSLTGLSVGTTTYYLKATNANGDSSASGGVSGTVIQPSNFYSIATYTVTSGGTSSVTFSSIPSGYTHLQIRGIGAITGGTTGSQDMAIFFNGTTSNNSSFSQHRLYGNGSSASSDYYSGYIVAGRFSFNTDANAGIFGSTVIDILDYTNTNKYKTVRTLTGVDSNGAGTVWLNSGLWQSTSAITSITLNDGFGGAVWHQYSSFALYGVK